MAFYSVFAFFAKNWYNNMNITMLSFFDPKQDDFKKQRCVMKRTFIALIIVAVLVLGGISVYAIQGLDETKSSRILANDGYATITTDTVGGEISTTAAALMEAAAMGGVHLTDTYSVVTLDAAFIQSLVDELSGDVVSFRIIYNSNKTMVTFNIRDNANDDLSPTEGRCVMELPYTASASAANSVVASYAEGGIVPLSTYYPDAGYIHFELIGGGTYSIVNNAVAFSDTTKHWGKTYIDFLASREIAAGVGGNRFGPNGSVTRAQFVRFLAVMSAEDINGYSTDKFVDVKSSDWYYHAVAWAVAANITSGVSSVQFAPNQKVTREQMAVLTNNFLNYMGIESKPIRSSMNFSDAAKISSWAKDSVNKCQGMAIISGYNDKTFRPSGTATRAEAAVICGRIVSYAMILPQ